MAGLLVLAAAGCGSVPGWLSPGGPGAADPAAAGAGGSRPLRRVEDLWMIPGGQGPDGTPAFLRSQIYAPPGRGPFPVAVINHGSPGDPGRQIMGLPTYRDASEWFVRRGYMVVLPLRRGYGEGGAWPENPGTCEDPDFISAGNAAADDIEAVVRHLRRLSIVRRDRILLVGQSAGGFGVIAAAARNPEGVFGVINIAGGRLAGEGDARCEPERLVQANGRFGETAKVPSLWLYAENDSYFDPELSRQMVSAYGEAGGRAVYVLLPPFKDEGHRMFGDPDGLALWTPQVAAFLDALE